MTVMTKEDQLRIIEKQLNTRPPLTVTQWKKLCTVKDFGSELKYIKNMCFRQPPFATQTDKGGLSFCAHGWYEHFFVPELLKLIAVVTNRDKTKIPFQSIRPFDQKSMESLSDEVLVDYYCIYRQIWLVLPNHLGVVVIAPVNNNHQNNSNDQSDIVIVATMAKPVHNSNLEFLVDWHLDLEIITP